MSQQVRRAPAQAVIMLVIGLVLLGGAATAIYFSRNDPVVDSYNSAPACATLDEAAAGKSCRLTTTATVTQIRGDGERTVVDFQLPAPYNAYSTATFPAGVEVDSSIREGSPVRVEVWGLRVTKLGDVNTIDHPATDPSFAHLLQIGLLLALFGVIAVAWAVVRARNPGEPGAPSISPIATSEAIFHQ